MTAVRPVAENPIKLAERPTSTATAIQKTAPEHVYDAVNELHVIRSCIASVAERTKYVRIISPSEFLIPAHAPIWRALTVFVEKQIEFSSEMFKQLVALEGGDVDESYLDELESMASVVPNLEWHVSTMRWDATRARVLKGPLPELVKELRDPKLSHERAVSLSLSITRAFEGGVGRRFIHRPEELRVSYGSEIDARVRGGNFWSFGNKAVDDKMSEGTMPKRTAVLVGLSSSGKSTFACDWVIQQARIGRKALYCAWEMDSESVIDVMVASMLKIELKRIIGGHLTIDEQVRVKKAIWWLTDHIKFMDNAFFGEDIRGPNKQGKRSNDRAQDVLEGYIAESGCDFVCMDLWERCLVDLSYDGVTTALFRQQDMHKRYNVYGVIVHQLRLKDIEKRTDKRPTRDGIKGTGAYVEVADQIFAVHRDAQFKSVPDDTLELICLKQRKGALNWAVQYDWDGATASITGGVEVPYDPGLESSAQFSDIGDIKERPSNNKAKRSTSRRDGY